MYRNSYSAPLTGTPRAAALSLIFLLTAVASVHARVSLETLRRDGYGMVELDRPQPNVLTVKSKINGRDARLIVDTGWGDDGITARDSFRKVLRSPVTPVKKVGHSATGAALGAISKGVADVVSIGNVQIRGVPLYVGKIGALEHSSNSGLRADGFLGAGFLRTCSAIIDLHNLRLYLRPPGTGHRAIISGALKANGLAEVPLTFSMNNCLVPVEINGAKGAMFVDTGAYVAEVDQRFVPQLNTKARMSRGRNIDAAGVESATSVANLKTFTVAGVPVFAPDLRIGQFAFYNETRGSVVGVLGMDILGKNGTIIDFGEKKLYLYGLPLRKPVATAKAPAAPSKGRKL